MPQVKVGCCGFSKGRKAYYSEFGLVEVQQTFYKLPAVDTARKWRQEAPPDFEYTMKAWQLITHPVSSPTYRKAGLKIATDKAKNYGFFTPGDEVFEAWFKTREIAKTLKARVIVFQCPTSFVDSAQNVENMKAFFKRVSREDFIFAWEPRGNWSERTITSLCRELNLIHCVDPFEAKPLYGRVKYFRLHGGPGYRHQYTEAELKQLLAKISGETYILFNNITRHDDALKLLQLLKGGG